MKSEELMIGDYFTLIDFNSPSRITAIYDDVVQLQEDYKSEFDEEWYSEAYIKDLKPIPLTPEILEMNGFVKYNEVSDTPPYDKDEEGNMYYSYKGEHKFWGWWQPNNVYFIPVNAMIDLEIKYVHQLQHALRLCGINKEIEI